MNARQQEATDPKDCPRTVRLWPLCNVVPPWQTWTNVREEVAVEDLAAYRAEWDERMSVAAVGGITQPGDNYFEY